MSDFHLYSRVVLFKSKDTININSHIMITLLEYILNIVMKDK